MFVRTEANLVFRFTVGKGLAVDRVLAGDFVRAAEAENQRAQAAAAGNFQCLVAGARHVHKRMRVLVRLGVNWTRRNVDQITVMLELILHPHFRNHIHRLVDLRRHHVERCAEGPGFLLCGAFADAEMHTAFRQYVQRRHTLGHLDRVIHVERQADDAMPNMNARGAAGDEGEKALGRGQMGILGHAVMFDRPDTVEPHLLGQDALVDDIVKDLRLVPARRIDHLRFVDDGKFHCPIFPVSARAAISLVPIMRPGAGGC
jgi:hypothetical protein